MNLKKFFFRPENRIISLLILSYIPAFIWWGLWSGGTILKWWQKLEGRIPAPLYFKWEEFIALNSHGNEYPGRLGLYLIIAAILVLLPLRAAKLVQARIGNHKR